MINKIDITNAIFVLQCSSCKQFTVLDSFNYDNFIVNGNKAIATCCKFPKLHTKYITEKSENF